jgi:hypothetical protein
MDEKEENKKRELIDIRCPEVWKKFIKFVDRNQKEICVRANQPAAEAKSDLIAFYRQNNFYVSFEGVATHLRELGPAAYWAVENDLTVTGGSVLKYLFTTDTTNTEKVFLEIYADEAKYVDQERLIAATVTQSIDLRELKKSIENTIFFDHDRPLRRPILLLKLCRIQFHGKCSSESPMSRYLSKTKGV